MSEKSTGGLFCSGFARAVKRRYTKQPLRLLPKVKDASLQLTGQLCKVVSRRPSGGLFIHCLLLYRRNTGCLFQNCSETLGRWRINDGGAAALLSSHHSSFCCRTNAFAENRAAKSPHKVEAFSLSYYLVQIPARCFLIRSWSFASIDPSIFTSALETAANADSSMIFARYCLMSAASSTVME